MFQIEARQWVGSEIKGETSVGNKALLDLIVRKFMFLVITVLLDAMV